MPTGRNHIRTPCPQEESNSRPHRGTGTEKIENSKKYCNQSCILTPITCIPYSFQRKISHQYLLVNNCKTIAGDGCEGHSSFTSARTTSTSRKNLALHMQLGSDNERCLGTAYDQGVRATPHVDPLPMHSAKGIVLWEGQNSNSGN